MADNTFGNRLGGRLNYEPQSVYKPSFGTFASGELSQSHQRLQTQMEAEYSAMQSAGQDSQSQLNRAIEQMKQDVQGRVRTPVERTVRKSRATERVLPGDGSAVLAAA